MGHLSAVLAAWVALSSAGYAGCAWYWHFRIVRRVCELKGVPFERLRSKAHPKDLALLQGEDRRMFARFQAAALLTLAFFFAMGGVIALLRKRGLS